MNATTATGQTKTPRLQIEGLTREFGGRKVVDGVSLQVMPGQVTCLLGPSGCGKSTTLRCVAGVDTPDQGMIAVDGDPVCHGATHKPPEQRSIGLMFQDFALFPHMSVAENVAFGLTGGRKSKRARVEHLLERVHLIQHIDHFPHELSGGEQQRAPLARAVAPRPKVMLTDEPVPGLHTPLRDGIRGAPEEILTEEGAAVVPVPPEPV